MFCAWRAAVARPLFKSLVSHRGAVIENWKSKFIKSASEFEDKDELEISYEFGNPATADDLQEFEKTLKISVPASFAELLSEFNGVDAKQKYWGSGHLYLSTNYIINEIPIYFKESGNYVPPKNEMDSVIFFAQQNGLSALFALCVKPFNNFKAGEVLVLESDTGEFELECGSLQEFVQSSEYCHLG